MMKKITLFLMFLTVTFGYSQTLPFDFEGTLHGFIGDNATVSNGTGNDVLQIVGGTEDWDNAQVTFATPIDLSDDDNNTLRFTFESTTAAAGELHQHGISFQGGGGSIEMNFQTVGPGVNNIELNFGAGLGSREKMVIFTDTGNFGAQSGLGGQTGSPTGGLTGTYIVDNISIGADAVGADASLSDLKVDAVTVTGFSSPTTSYVYEVAEGTTVVPTVTATTTDAGATAVVTPAASIPGNTSVVVTAANGTTTATYTVSFSFPIGFPFDFEGSLQGFIGDGGPAVTNGSGNDVLEIAAGVSDWDNAQITFTTPVDLSDDANNTLRFTFQSTTAEDGEIHQHGISFQDTAGGIGGSYEANFQTTGTEVANIELDFVAGLGTSAKFVIFTDVGDLGAIQATPNVNGLADAGKKSGTYIVDNITLGATVLNVKNNSVLDFSMYPNPTSNMLNISAKEIIQDTHIFNVLGKNVMSVNVNDTKASIDVSNLATGIYLVKYIVNGTRGSAKFVKQ